MNIISYNFTSILYLHSKQTQTEKKKNLIRGK